MPQRYDGLARPEVIGVAEVKRAEVFPVGLNHGEVPSAVERQNRSRLQRGAVGLADRESATFADDVEAGDDDAAGADDEPAACAQRVPRSARRSDHDDRRPALVGDLLGRQRLAVAAARRRASNGRKGDRDAALRGHSRREPRESSAAWL
jgi:hypothetical protein